MWSYSENIWPNAQRNWPNARAIYQTLRVSSNAARLTHWSNALRIWPNAQIGQMRLTIISNHSWIQRLTEYVSASSPEALTPQTNCALLLATPIKQYYSQTDR